MTRIDSLAITLSAAVAGSLLAGVILRAIISRALARWAKRTLTQMDDAIVSSLQRPILLWCVLLGLFIALRIREIPDRLKVTAEHVLIALLILSVTLWIANLSVRLLVLSSRDRKGEAGRATGLMQYTVKIGILVMGGLILLASLGVSIAPLLTTLGIGGLAIALGLQETLSNIFAGMHITLARNIRVGDFVRLETGEEGYVEDIGWRSTRIQVLPNNMVLIPNNRLAQSIVTNYSLPSRDLAVLVQVGVHYSSDLARVEEVTCDVGRSVMKDVTGAVAEFEPFIRYHTFGDSSIDFTVILRAKEFVDNYLIKHEFIKRLHARYEEEGIVIPYPIRAVNLSQEGAAVQLSHP
jgi:small-conductance mechanosensitive channel